MGSEIEIPETPNWLKELEAKRERRLKTKLGHELGAGAPCLTCEEKCPGLDLHFWRKICKNCKCSKENHEVQDDDIYGWAQDELLGTKVNRLKKKIVLPGRKDEVELEWTPSGQKETIDKYLKTLPPELLPIKGSQAAQDRKQLLKKQIPVHDIDPTLCHELTDEELKKMQEYVAHIKQSSVGVGHLIQINFERGLSHVLDKKDAMFLINNVPKAIVSSENVILQGSNNSVAFKNLSNTFGNLDIKDKRRLDVHDPNILVTPEIDEQHPLNTNIKDKHYNINDSISKNNADNFKLKQFNSYSPQNHRISAEDIQEPKDTTLRNVNYPENLNDNIPVSLNIYSDKNLTPQGIDKLRDIQYHAHNLYGNSNVKNLVPSAFVPIKTSNESYSFNEVPNAFNFENNSTRDLPYPSQFISEQLKYRKNLSNFNPETSNIGIEYQNPAFFEPIKDVRYSPSQHEDRSQFYPQESQLSTNNNPEAENSPSNLQSSGLKQSNEATDLYSMHIPNSAIYYPKESRTRIPTEPHLLHSSVETTYNAGGAPSLPNPISNSPGSINASYKSNDHVLKGPNVEGNEQLGRINQTASPLPHFLSGKSNLHEDQQQPFKIKSIKDLAYSTYDSLPQGIQEGEYHSLSVKDRLNIIKKDELPVFRPSNSPISESNLSPDKIFTRDQRGITFDNAAQTSEPSENQGFSRPSSFSPGMGPENFNIPGLSPQHSLSKNVHLKSPLMQNTISEDQKTQSPSWHRDLRSLNKGGNGTSSPKNISENDPQGRQQLAADNLLHSTSSMRYQNLPSYAPGNKNVHEDYLQPKLIPIGGIRDVEYEDPQIRTAISKDNDLFEGSVPSKFIPNFCISNLPCCHYCEEKFKQDELAIAIPERSEAIFHTNCFKCHGCNQILADMFYFYDKDTDNVYCGRDYAKIRGIPRCRACDELIFVKEYCLAENSTFHVKHFCCFECDKPLAGQNYVMENDQPVCVPCYEITKANKCYACKDVIHPDQQGLQLKDGVHFHASEECFACKVCKKSLFGAKLLFRKDCLYCSHDCYNSDL